MRTAILTLTTCLFVFPVQAQYSGGSGTADDAYRIATAADLITLGETPDDYDKHFILTADIDLDPNLPGRKAFDRAVIAPHLNLDFSWPFDGTAFVGGFDGCGHTVSNLTVEGVHYLGLFGQVAYGAEISNLGLVAVDINGVGDFVGGLVGSSSATVVGSYSTGKLAGNQWVGGLVGLADGGLIRQCRGNCVVSGSGYDSHHIGGLLGANGDRGSGAGTVTECFSAGTVDGGESGFVGGLIGGNFGSVSGCYSTSTVNSEGSAWLVGGLIGSNMGIVTQCYSTGSVTGRPDPWSMVGGLIGGNCWSWPDLAIGSGGEVFDSFWDIQTSGQTGSGGGTALTTAEMQTANTFLEAGWDFVGETENGPNDVWKIVEGQTYPLLSWQKYGGGTGEPNDPYLIYTAEHLNALGAEPNDYDKHFRLMADIDLSGHVYDWAVIAPDTNDPEWDFQGTAFSGVFDGNGHAVLHLTITGKSHLGLFGQLGSGAKVRDLGVVDVNVTGSYYAVGGLVGNNFGGGITACYSTGAVTGYTHVGGLTGYNEIGEIAASYSACAVSATLSGNQRVGGLVGVNAGRITTSYSTGAVSGQRVVGGLVGLTTGSISMCYSTGMVTADQNVGGLVGERHPAAGIVAGCFWDVETSGQSTSAGGTSKTTAEMQAASTFLEAGWDFVDETENGTDDIWWIDEGQDYPRLWWGLGDEASPQIKCQKANSKATK